MSLTALDAAILAKLQAISALQVVQNEFSFELSGYPAVTFETTEGENEPYTNRDNLRSRNYEIVVHHEMWTRGRSFARASLEALVETIIAAFDSDLSLGGTCHFTRPVTWKFGTYTAANGDVMYVILLLKCVIEEQVLP